MVYYDNAPEWGNDIHVPNRTRIPASNPRAHQNQRTCWSSRRSTASLHTFTFTNTIAEPSSSLYYIWTRGIMTSYWQIITWNWSAHQYERTNCLPRTNSTPCHTFNEHKRRATIAIEVYFQRAPACYATSHCIEREYKLQTQAQQYKRTTFSSGANATPLGSFKSHAYTAAIAMSFEQHTRGRL